MSIQCTCLWTFLFIYSVCKSKTIEGSGWIDYPYGVSKLGVILLSMEQAKTISRDKSREDILVNAVSKYFSFAQITLKPHFLHPFSYGSTRVNFATANHSDDIIYGPDYMAYSAVVMSSASLIQSQCEYAYPILKMMSSSRL